MPVERSANPPGYPAEWEADVVLSDGGLARLRPIRPDDADLLVDFYARVSDESKYLRFFAPYPRLSDRDVERFTTVDYVDRVAFILTVGEKMIAVGRYERLEDDRAEVAFLVEDSQQGRGIGQLLLEHLAEAARERGITGFVADVLPENERMAQVFAEAGYQVSRAYEDGVLSVEFPILPSDTSVGVMERREHRAEGASIRRMLNPERVVVLGAGAKVQTIVTAMLSGGFRGELVAVSTDHTAVAGVPTSPTLATVDGRIDLVLASIPRDDLGAAVIDAAHKGAHAMVVLTGADIGINDSHRVVSLARAYGIRALGPDALGLINTATDVALTAIPGPVPRPGSVGLFCQSAATGVAMLAPAIRRHLGISSFISTGEYADVSGNDVMQYWEDDDDTRVCLMSLDTLGNPRKFTRVIRRLARRKPVVVYSPGRARRTSYASGESTPAGQKSLAHAPEAAVDALFRQSGVIVVGRRDEMIGIAQVAGRQPLPAGPRTRLITNSETLAHQLAQTVISSGLLLAGEPWVLPPSQQPEAIAELARNALADDSCDAVLCAVVGVFGADPQEARWRLEELAATSTKPLLAGFLDFTDVEDADEAEEPDIGQSLPIFDAPVDAIRALAAVSAYAHWRERDPGAVPMLQGIDPAAAKRVINKALADAPDGRRLTDDEAADLLAAYGIGLVRQRRVNTLSEAMEAGAGYGWNVVLKATAEKVRGRPDLASVFRNLDGPDAMKRAWSDLTELVAELGPEPQAPGMETAGTDELAAAAPVVQPMVAPGVPLRVTSREDAAFGPIVELGLAGIASDLLGDTAFRVPPLTTVDAAAMVRDLRAAPTLFGRGGSPGVDTSKVEELLHRVSQLADELPQLAYLLLTPCIATRAGLSVLGARIEIAPIGEHRDPLARVL
ncbi:bifunctional acetate--CoA ligase family protein/GNAT family N-acetyltransferase [Microlunatus elymi]|uniref:bifunctional acetate--CoA ligase family protein/GNAT family N-acetyltransferase n=1 Tax=Microlunatus elymi TaxID=2596828 RepID=UPI00143D693E|nr:GNAT family N-acetyltransferase [Microlunatus elymi]